MKTQLFSSFRLGQWIRLAVVGFLAGEMGTFGGCTGRIPYRFPDQQSQHFQATGLAAGAGILFVLMLCLAVLLALVLAVAFIYVNSRMRFVLFDSVLAGECRIREFWGRRGVPAFRYFIWQLLFGLATGVALLLVIGIPLAAAFGMGWLTSPGDHILPLVLCGILLGIIVLAAVCALAVVQVLVKDFVVPQMVFDDVTVVEGWRRLWSMMMLEKGGYAGYLGMKLVLRLAAGIVLGIVSIIVLLVMLIPVGGAGLIAVLGGNAAGLTWNPLTIAIAVAAGIFAFAGILFVMSMISVPAIVFFPAYSIHFFAERYPALHAVLYPLPPAPDAGSLPPV